LAKFLKYFKEWQALTQKSAAINKQIGAVQTDNAILDADTTAKILTSMNLSNTNNRSSA